MGELSEGALIAWLAVITGVQLVAHWLAWRAMLRWSERRTAEQHELLQLVAENRSVERQRLLQLADQVARLGAEALSANRTK